MRIAWFSPFDSRSAIGRYSRFAVEELGRHHEIDVFVVQKEDLQPTRVQPIFYSKPEDVVDKLKEYDLTVYNMGDYAPYHAAIYEVLRCHRGVVICHDLCLQNFFRGYFIDLHNDVAGYLEILTRRYGSGDAAKVLEAGRSSETWAELDLLRFSLSEEIADLAQGVVVHSEYHRQHVERHYQGPIAVVPLLDMNDLAETIPDTVVPKRDKNRIEVLTVGIVNPGKRIHAVIEAIGRDRVLQGRVHYTVIGPMENPPYAEQLKSLIARFGIGGTVHLSGYVGHEELMERYREADIAINLRYPAYEGGSASLVEQMGFGKGIIVSNTGVYAEIPADCLFKIDPEHEVSDLTKLLKDLVDRPDIVLEHGKRAQSYAREHFSRDGYEKDMTLFLHRMEFLKPLERLTRQLEQELQTMGATDRMAVLETLSTEMEKLFLHPHPIDLQRQLQMVTTSSSVSSAWEGRLIPLADSFSVTGSDNPATK